MHPHPGARYVAVSSSPDEVIQLVEGAIDVDVQPLHPGERFRVLVGDTELEVRGTTFTVSASEQHLVDVAVRHGRVDLRPRKGGTASLTAGQSWHATSAAVPLASSPLESSPSPSPAPPTTRHSASPAPQPSRQSALRPSIRASARASARAPASVVPDGDASAALATAPADAARAGSSAGDRAPELAPMVVSSGAASASVERSYDQAWEALRVSDFHRAAGGFARVVLLAPDGPLVEDASFWRAVALARGQRGAEARSAFRDFLDSFGRSPHAGEASAMLGWLLIDTRSYDEAAQRFTAAARDVNPAVRRSARAGLDALARRER